MVDEAFIDALGLAFVRNHFALPVFAGQYFSGVKILPDQDHHDLVACGADPVTGMTRK
jgi:hypothetical protein